MSENKEEDFNNNLLKLGANLLKHSSNKVEEKNLIIIGDNHSGKTMVFNTALQKREKDLNYSQTCGINYNYIRYQPSNNKKFLLNVFEIGGGIDNINLLKNILNEQNIRHSVFVLCLDLEKPYKLLDNFKNFTKSISSVLKEVSKQDDLINVIETKKTKYLENSDIKRLSIFPAELLIVCNKYNSFEKLDM